MVFLMKVDCAAVGSLEHCKATGERLLQWDFGYMALARSDRKGRKGDQ